MQIQQIKLNGFDRIQKVIMQYKLAAVATPKEEVAITLTQSVKYGKYDCHWFGGIVAEMFCGDRKYCLIANGDIIVNLYDKQTNEHIVYVKDKSNSGRFYDEMSRYIENDSHLYSIIEDKDPKYRLDFVDNNWFEFVADDQDSIYYGGHVMDFSNIFDAIASAIELIKEELDEEKLEI